MLYTLYVICRIKYIIRLFIYKGFFFSVSFFFQLFKWNEVFIEIQKYNKIYFVCNRNIYDFPKKKKLHIKEIFIFMEMYKFVRYYKNLCYFHIWTLFSYIKPVKWWQWKYFVNDKFDIYGEEKNNYAYRKWCVNCSINLFQTNELIFFNV